MWIRTGRRGLPCPITGLDPVLEGARRDRMHRRPWYPAVDPTRSRSSPPKVRTAEEQLSNSAPHPSDPVPHIYLSTLVVSLLNAIACFNPASRVDDH